MAPGCRSPPSHASTSLHRRSAKRWATASPRLEIAASGLLRRASAATLVGPRRRAAIYPISTAAVALAVLRGEAVVAAAVAARTYATRCPEKEGLVKEGTGKSSRRCPVSGGSNRSCRHRRRRETEGCPGRVAVGRGGGGVRRCGWGGSARGGRRVPCRSCFERRKNLK